MRKFTILHTSDWHLGHQLYRNRRDDEFQMFLQWVIKTLRTYEVDALLVAGDIFDTAAPASSAQKLYYDFLGQAVKTGCRHIVITAGNHDSPAFLTAPHELLQSFDIHVLGHADENGNTLLLTDDENHPACIISALPYLRERDLRQANSDTDDLLAGLRHHYGQAANAVQELRQAHGDLPAVAMGHLFVNGSSMDGEGERIIQVGNLDQAPRDIFPPDFDYIALGHIHRPQAVGGDAHCRYSGAPLPMSFAEAAQNKSVVLLSFTGRETQMELLPVPQIRHLRRLSGSREELLEQLAQIIANEEDAWIEINHDGSDAVADLNDAARKMAEGTKVNVLCVKVQPTGQSTELGNIPRDLSNCTEEDIFRILLESRQETEERRERLMATFRQLLVSYGDSIRSEVE